MCNLNIVLLKDRRKYKNLTSFLMAVTSNSYISNNDGDGIFCNNKIVKQKEKIDLFSLDKDIKKSNIIFTHQRRATSGFSEKWSHPFINKDFVLVHNGIINDFIGKRGSDTWGFFIKFNKKFKEEIGNREKRIVKSIKSLLDKKQGLYYSIAILDRITNKVYYFKNETANIHFYKSKGLIYITTSDTNNLLLSLLQDDFKEVDVKNQVIYQICKDLIISKVGKIKKKKIKNFQYLIEESQKNPKGLFEFSSIKTQKIENEFLIVSDPRPCFYCGKLTHQISKVDYEAVCENCDEEETKKLRGISMMNYI